MTAKYLNHAGYQTLHNDPDRMVWHSPCTYWTDDWTKLRDAGGIPICPTCGCPGFQTDYQNWIDSAIEFEKTHPYYVEFLNQTKEECRGRQNNFMQDYENWLKNVKQHEYPSNN